MPMLYVSIRRLHVPEPARITRRDGITLATFDPTCARWEAALFINDHLDEQETAQFRRAYGGPPAPEPCPSWWVADRPLFLYVPPSVRLTGALAIQGGDVADERKAAGSLLWEERALQAEMTGRKVAPVMAAVY